MVGSLCFLSFVWLVVRIRVYDFRRWLARSAYCINITSTFRGWCKSGQSRVVSPRHMVGIDLIKLIKSSIKSLI